MRNVKRFARTLACAACAGAAAWAPAWAGPNAASPDSYGDRNIGHFGDPNQGYFGDPDVGSFLNAHFDPIRGKFEPRPGAPASAGSRPYLVLKHPVAEPSAPPGATRKPPAR